MRIILYTRRLLENNFIARFEGGDGLFSKMNNGFSFNTEHSPFWIDGFFWSENEFLRIIETRRHHTNGWSVREDTIETELKRRRRR